jgi:hypothetical protein
VHAEAKLAAMSFDIFFQPCRFTETAVGASHNEPLTAVEERAVRSILARACPHGPDDHHCWAFGVGDGGHAEVFGGNLGEGCMFAVNRMTPDLVQLMFDILVGGNWVMLPAQEEARAIVASRAAVPCTPKGFPDLVICESAQMLGALLAGGIEAWARHRDAVANR